MDEELSALFAALEGRRRLLIVTHDNPDPDALASASALAYLAAVKTGLRSRICCEGIAGRAENRAVIRELRLKLMSPSRVNWNRWRCVAMVDTQPGAGNNSFPARRVPDIVIDHHPLGPRTKARFLDVRPDYGACATILAQYLQASGVAPTPVLAATMCYAISSETQDLVRQAAEADTQAYLQLYPMADKRALGRILHPRLMHSYYAVLARAVLSAFTHGNVIGSHLGDIPHPDFVGLIADLLLRHERMGWCIVTGVWQGDLYISLRAMPGRLHAGTLLARVLKGLGQAGGHGSMAGGRVPVKGLDETDRSQLQDDLVMRLIRLLHRRSEAVIRPLLEPADLGQAAPQRS